MTSKNAAQPTWLGHDNPIFAVISGLLDLLDKRGQVKPLPTDFRIDGKRCLVTGANTGLGKAIAIDLAKRGGHVIMACRSGIPDAGEDVKRQSGSKAVEMLPVDLADLNSVSRLAEQLQQRGEHLDIVVLNAGLMPQKARPSTQGYDLMFAVHYLANRLLLTRLLASGVIANRSFANYKKRGKHAATPRIVFVSSEAHRSAKPIDFANLGAFVDFNISGGMRQYGLSKLVLNTYAAELARRLTLANGDADVQVAYMCPGPVNSNIARETPAWLRPLLAPVMQTFFRAPSIAAQPVIYLACSPDLAGEQGVYMHMLKRKAPSPLGSDAGNGRKLWELGALQLQGFLNGDKKRPRRSKRPTRPKLPKKSSRTAR